MCLHNVTRMYLTSQCVTLQIAWRNFTYNWYLRSVPINVLALGINLSFKYLLAFNRSTQKISAWHIHLSLYRNNLFAACCGVHILFGSHRSAQTGLPICYCDVLSDVLFSSRQYIFRQLSLFGWPILPSVIHGM